MTTENHEFPFLEEVYIPPEPPKIDLVFVHGLNPLGKPDHAFGTWRHENGTFWPRDLLPEDIPQARVFIYGYNSNVTHPQSMSTASVKDHANTLLNLLDMERSPLVNARPPKIIFIGHSLGGLVIKQALLNAHEDPKYTSIRNATCGLVFFGCPHRGTKGVELGKIAAKVARFVSKGHASNELLDCLEFNSLFTRQMTSRFSHQLEDYRVVSFVEGKEVMLGGVGPASVSHLVVDEESAVLGLPGNRETRLKFDADHSQMCKVGARGAMYKLIKGNMKQIVDQVLVAEQGYVPPPSTASPLPSPPLPPRMHMNSSSAYPPPTAQKTGVIGTLYTAIDNDPRAIQAAEHKNNGQWEAARNLEYAIFQDQLRTLGTDHHSTLLVAYNLAEIDLEAGHVIKATEWCQWVCSNAQRVLDTKHPLSMKAESLMGEILCNRGKHQDSESVCANVLARQQMTIGEDDLDTLETRRRLANAYGNLGQEQNAVGVAEARTQALTGLLGPNHIRVLQSVLDTVEVMVTARTQNGDKMHAMRFSADVQQTSDQMGHMVRELTVHIGPRHPLTIRAQRLQGILQMLEGNTTQASETFRRGLANSEDALGREHTESMNIVASIGLMYAMQNPLGMISIMGDSSGNNLRLASPWLLRYLNWAESRKGKDNPDVQAMLSTLGQMNMGVKQYREAEGYFERLMESYREAGTPAPEHIQSYLQTCRIYTRMLAPKSGIGGGLEGVLSSFYKRF